MIKYLFSSSKNYHEIINNLPTLSGDNYNRPNNPSISGFYSDAESIVGFLSMHSECRSTLTLYATNIEKFMLWCIHNCPVNFHSIRASQIMDYKVFLQSDKTEEWIGPPQDKKSGNWKPFCKKLSDSSIKMKIATVRNLFNYLARVGYLSYSPFAHIPKICKVNTSNKYFRYLDSRDVQHVINTLTCYEPPTSRHTRIAHRARYVIMLFFYTGLRVSEAASAKMSDIIRIENAWFLRVIGKGSKERYIPLPDKLITEINVFRNRFGYNEVTFGDDSPILPNLRVKTHMNPHSINQLIRWAFKLAADECEDEYMREKLNNATAHWLRHSYVTALLRTGAPLCHVQENVGHSSVNTTMIYYHISQKDRYDSAKGFKL